MVLPENESSIGVGGEFESQDDPYMRPEVEWDGDVAWVLDDAGNRLRPMIPGEFSERD